jgi:NADPH-dependent curcumin reductase
MRDRMNAGPSYAPPIEVGQVMEGGTITAVVASRSAAFVPGEVVLGYTGWQEYAVAAANALQKTRPSSRAGLNGFGCDGDAGLTAYTGLLNIGQPKPGETVVVAAASGAVGSLVGQIAKIKGCRAVGVAGGRRKCDFVVSELGFDACVDHHSAPFPAGSQSSMSARRGCVLRERRRPGFESRPSAHESLWTGAGVWSDRAVQYKYNSTGSSPGIDRLPALMGAILVKRLTFKASS